jgi:hypothetical protein
VTRSRTPGEDDDDLEGFMEEVRRPGTEILARYGITGTRAVEILSHSWVAVALTNAGRPELRRQFLESVETACRELRAALGPLEEEDDERSVH